MPDGRSKTDSSGRTGKYRTHHFYRTHYVTTGALTTQKPTHSQTYRKGPIKTTFASRAAVQATTEPPFASRTTFKLGSAQMRHLTAHGRTLHQQQTTLNLHETTSAMATLGSKDKKSTNGYIYDPGTPQARRSGLPLATGT